MKKMWKRFVSLLLACTLLAGMLPLSASAAEKPGEGSNQYQYAKGILDQLNNELGYGDSKFLLSPAAPLGGDSDLFTYVISRFYIDPVTNEGTTDMRYVIVPGVGASDTTMPNYSSAKDGQPWAKAAVSTFYIAKGVTGIGSYAFASQPSLNNVVFQDASDLTYIGQRAFYDDDNAVFTDEGNEDKTTTLDLSGVTTMGEYAFYNCDKLTGVKLGNMTAIEGNEEIPNKIPNNAFNNSGLQTVTIPDGIQHIGDGAFGHTSLSKVEDLVLPDGLKTIGDNAFVVTMGSGDTSVGITSLTIPSSVESIGDNAFSGRRNLAEVTVEDDKQDGTKLELGNAAFGHNESSAFSEWGSITDDRTGQKYEGTMGTKFYLPADLTEKFINGTNCYTGDIEPMKWVKTQQPTCDTDGYHLYETTKKGAYDDEGRPLVLQYKYTIPMLGHDWNDGEPIPASCERNSYTLYTCKREGCGDTYSDNFGQDATGHEYTLISVTNPSMGNGQSTTFKWVCQKSGHDETRDGKPITVEISVSPSPISATTTTKYGELQLPKVNGGTLSLAADVNEDELLEIGDTSVNVVYTPDDVAYAGYTGMAPVDSFTGTDLTLQINVSKAKLDFSSVRFGNCLVGINPGEEETVPITIERGNLPEDVKAGDPVYTEHESEEGSTIPPSIGENWTGTVSVTFTYDPKKYEEETKNLPPEYTYFRDLEAGTVTITHSYVVTKLEMTNVSATAIPDLAYTGSSMNTVHVYGIPAGSTVFWKWVSTTDGSVTGMGSAENENSPYLQIAEIKNAGTYEVTITIQNASYEDYTLPSPVTVNIQKAKVETPEPKEDLVYTSLELTGLVSPDENAEYAYKEGSKLAATDAGTYTATAVLRDTANYEWTESDNDNDGEVAISWTIAKRPVIETSITRAFISVLYDGNVKRAVSEPTNATNFFTVNYVNGTLIGKVASSPDEEAFTIKHAEETNAGTYEVIATITDFDNFYWQNHSAVESYSLGTWTINPLQINAPTINAESTTYTGETYNGEVTLKHSEASDSRGSSQDIIDLDDTNIRYYTQRTGGNGGDAPVNAGTYFAGVESNGWAFVEGKVSTNYQIIGGSRAQFSISKATATMEFSLKAVPATYTAEGTALQPVTVTGLVGKDIGKEEDVKGEVQYSYKYSQTPDADWSTVNPTTINDPQTHKFTEVGYYQITAKWGAGTVSNNYTAKDAIYTLTITQAETQDITLTPDKLERWTAAEGQTPAKYTITYGAAATFTVIGKAALDNASISYAVKGDSSVVSVDGSSGVVTIHKAGTATITVTAAETPNVGAASVEYTVTVKKAKPTVNTGLEGDELTVAYTGKAITGYNKATAAANVVEGAAKPTGDITYTFYTDQECKNKVTNGDGEGNNIPIAVGTYYMKATYPGDTNYESAVSKPVTVTVTKAQLTVDAEGHTGTYDGETHSAITIKSVTGNGTTLAQGQYTVKYAKTNTNIAPGADAGDDVWQDDLTVKDVADSSSDKLYYWYMVTADNYNPAIGKVEVKITPAPLTVTGEPASYEKEYDGDKEVDEALTDITVTAEDVPDVTISVAATGTYADKDAGTKKDVTLTLTLSGTDGTEIDWGNYSYNDQALTEGKITLTKAGAGTITPKAITVTGISAVNRVYDGTTKVQLTGTPETTEGSFIGKDDVSFSAISNQTGTVTDAKAEDGKTVTVAAETLKGLLTGEDAENYTVTQEYPTTVDITPRPVTLQFPNGNSSMTTSYDPNGLTSKPNVYKVSAVAPAEGTGFVSSDALADGDIQYTFKQDDKDVENPINVGEYTVTAELTDEAAKKWSNYTIEAITGTVEIIQATEELTVTVTEKTGLTYTGQGQDPIQSISVKGGNVTLSEDDGDYEVQFKLSEEGDYELDRDQLTAAVKDAKEYTVYWQVTTTNYGNKTDSFTVKVAPATLTLSSSLTKEKKYDGATEAVVTGQKVTGAQNNESITVSSVSAAYDDANVDTDKTITTTYTVTFGADVTPGNYTYTGNVEGKATSTWTIKTTVEDGKITQAPITVAINDQKKVYDGQSLSIENPVQDTHWSTTGTIYLQDGVKDDLGITLSIASGSKDAGTYAITGAASNQNYEVTFTGSWTGEDDKGKAGTYTISPRPINVQIGDAEGFYGDEPVLDNVTLDDVTEDGVSNAGLVDGEVLKEVLTGLELATIANAQSDISDEDTTYTIYAKKGGAPVQAPTQLGNYNVTFTNKGTYTVKPRPITITIVDHSSVYGAEINEGIDNPVSDKDYKVAITGNATTGDAIVNNDVLTVTLETTASAKAAAGTYDITGSAEGNKVNNYAITWAGNGSAIPEKSGQNYGKYTIDKAGLKVEFDHHDKVSNGVSINITDSYNANPLVLKNASTDAEVSEADKSTLGITYSIAEAGENGGSTNVATINETTGEVTIHSTGTVRVTVTVKPQDNSNYTGQVTTWYELNIIGGGQMTLTVTKNADLVYNGSAQKLLQSVSCSLDGADLQYKVDDGEWTENEPTGTNAGTYTVYVKATDPSGQYSEVTEHVTVAISKATLEGSFAQKEYTHVLTTGNSYDSAQANELTISSAGYGAEPAKYTYRSADTTVAMAENGGSTIRIMGSAGQETTITVTVPGDNNYNEGTFTYTLKISDDLSKIKYNVTGITTTYNGQPQTIKVEVTQPDSGATVRYWNESTNAYTLSEPPAYTDVQDGGYPIKFQITAPGYKKVDDGTATLTINPKPIKKEMIAGIAESYTYTGKEITFDDAISVHDEGVLLKQNTDYTISYDDNTAVGTGTVTITGKGNYRGSVTKSFTISPVDASDLTASLDRTFGYYDDSETNNATVTVTHGRHTVDSSEIELTVTRKDDTSASSDVTTDDLKLTFNKAGIYTIHVEVSGTHTGTFDLTYTLLPQDVASDDFQVATDPVDRVWTYDGENHAFGVTVTSGGTSLQKDVDFTLHYTYLPYVGNPTDDVYDPGTTAFTEAGIYTVIVEGTGNYTGHAELVALIQPRDLSDAGIAAAIAQTGLVYNGEAQEPDVTLTYNGAEISQLKDTEYYGNTNAGEAQALSAASEDCNNFTGARVDAFTIEKKSLKDSTITAKADPEEYYYTGYPVTPAVTVTDSDRNVDLSIGADYTVTSDAVGPGKVTATVTGTGNYKDTVTVEFTILPTGAEPVETLNLTVTPSEWTWDNGQTKAAISVTFNGKELNDTDYQLTVSKDGETPQTVTKEQAVELLSAPDEYTITATGVGAYNGSTDTETVTIQKIQPEVTVKATPNSLSGGGKVTLTLKGEKLPDDTDLKNLLKVTAKNDSDVTLEDLHIQWPEDGSLTAELTLPNTNETYTFALRFAGDEYYEPASSDAMVVVGQQTSGGGGGSDPGDQPADPDDTGVSDWLNTKDHLAYLAGYPGGTFGPDQNMTRAEAAQMFYNLLLEKDVEITVEFEDVPADAWYAKPVNTLASLGILSGVGNGRFDPERSITRAEFTVIAMKFANTSGGGVNIFSDVNEDDWFYSAVVDSTQYGWINGYPDGTFRPEATISRAEVTVIVNHMLGRAADRPYVIAHEEELNTFGDVNRGHWGYFHVAEATNAHEYHTEDGTESWTGLS